MRYALLILACAASALAQNGSDFQQTQGPSSYGGLGGNYGNSWRSEQSQTGTVPAARPPMGPDPSTVGGDSVVQSKKARRRGGDERGSADHRDGSAGAAAADGDERPAGAAGDAPAPVDLDTARANFATLVESYVANHSPKGYWSYAAKKGTKARRLAKPAVDEDSVRKVKGSRYAARVTLRDQASRKPVALEFEADFSGSEWKIVAVRPATVNIRR